MKFGTYILIFYFFIGACIPKNDFSQLLNIYDLVEHFEEHQQEALAVGEAISFSEFLLLHFFETEQHQHDSDNSHDNLPLKNITTTVVLYIDAQPILTISSEIFHPPRLS